MMSIRVRFSEFEFERELEVALRIRSAIGGRVNDAQVSIGSQLATRRVKLPDRGIRVVQVDVVEKVYRFDAELKLLRFGELDPLEERRVGSPVAGAAERVTLQAAEFARPRVGEDRGVDAIFGSRQIQLWIAIDIRAIRPGVDVGAGVITEVEWQAALDRGVRVELPSADQVVSPARDAAEKSPAFAEGELPQLREDDGVLPVPIRRSAVEVGVEGEILVAVLQRALQGVMREE